MKLTWVIAIAGIVLFMGMAPAFAHHSFAAEYDANQPIELRGVVTKVEWTNPHARFYIDVKDDRGDVVNWNFELASPSVLSRNGWKPSSLKSGDPITVAGYLARSQPASGSKMAVASGVTSSDGTRLFASPAKEVRSEEHTSELQSRGHLVCRLLLEKKNHKT